MTPHPHGSVLLADDHGLVRHGLQLLLGEVLPQLRVHLAGSLAETVQALQGAGRFDLVLLDLTLSDVHGLVGLRRLREDFPYVPVVILSAQDDRDTVLAALDAGAMGFISKAASPDELREALTRVLVDHRIHLPQSVSGGMAALPEGGGRRRRQRVDERALGDLAFTQDLLLRAGAAGEQRAEQRKDDSGGGLHGGTSSQTVSLTARGRQW